MTSRLRREELFTRDEIAAPPIAPELRACTDQNFGLPTPIYLAMFGFFAGVVAVLALEFRSSTLVSYGVILALLIAFFGVPALMVGTSPTAQAKALSWSQFRMKGIATATGQASAAEAVVLALLLPFFVFVWAVSVTLIAHFVG